MPEWMAVLIGAGAVVVAQGLTAAFVYGRTTERLSAIGKTTDSHALRLGNLETVVSGTGGHGERLTALEAWRLEHRAQIHT